MITFKGIKVKGCMRLIVTPVRVHINGSNELTYECRGLFYGVGEGEPSYEIAMQIGSCHKAFAPFTDAELAVGAMEHDVYLTSFMHYSVTKGS